MFRLNLKTSILTFLHILECNNPDRIIIMGSQATIILIRNIGEWTQRTPKNIDAVKAAINQKGMSVRRVTAGLGMKKDSMHRIPKKVLGLHPYKFICYRSWKRMIPTSECRMTRVRWYKEKLEEEVILALMGTCDNFDNLIFMLDGAPAYFSNKVYEVLDELTYS
uniref:Uncharacterized protein n=1 Tax=Acrobeloides nanus TaxID=290746 RepID=A0A914CMI4_9BILA